MANGPELQAFSYHRSLAPAMWVLVGLCMIELLVVHGLVALWSWRVAASLSVASLAGIVWLVCAIGAMRRLPVLLDAETLVWRVGGLRGVRVAVADVAGIRPEWDGDVVKTRSTLNLALLAYPNLVVDLHRPLPGRRGVVALAHRLDDPAAFAQALERLGSGG